MKPWMIRREGESSAQHRTRLNHSCYRCGHMENDLRVLAGHEDACTDSSSDSRSRTA